MTTTVLLGVAAMLPLPVQGEPVFAREIAKLTSSSLESRYEKTYGTKMPHATGADVYKLSYPSPNSPQGFQRLSGALFVPTGVRPRGLVLFFHGTSVKPETVPSRMPDSSIEAALPFLAQGFAVTMPDYVGQGDSKGRHPYPLGKINAWSGIDMVPHARRTAARQGWHLGDNLFISGYSEGGAVAMWATRHLQERPELGLKLRASAPLSGPYDLSRTTARSMVADVESAVWRAVRVFLVGYIGYSAVAWVPGFKLEDYFVPSFASYIPLAFETSQSDDEITQRLVVKAIQIRPITRSIKPILQPSFTRALESADRRNSLINVLAENDAYDWAPQTPMLLVALEKDQVVVPENTTATIHAMRARGVPESRVKAVMIPDDLNHITGAPKCILMAAEFFVRHAAND